MFSRNRGSGRHAKGDNVRTGARINAQRRAPDDSGADLDLNEELAAVSASPEGEIGPYDITEAPSGIPQLDLGSLLVPAVDGVEVRVQADNEGRIQQVVLVVGESGLQLGVFAAPRTEGIWDEVRAEIRKQLFEDGVAAEEVDGVYGPELRARVRTPEGLTDIRFVGIDGPRWLVRAVYQGPAAVDPSVAPALVECLQNLVVKRGIEAMPVREPLPLTLPQEMAEQAAAAQEAEQQPPGTNGTPRRRPSPRPRK
jgi:hypothetical protein